VITVEVEIGAIKTTINNTAILMDFHSSPDIVAQENRVKAGSFCKIIC
jgi:hypothetical protein